MNQAFKITNNDSPQTQPDGAASPWLNMPLLSTSSSADHTSSQWHNRLREELKQVLSKTDPFTLNALNTLLERYFEGGINLDSFYELTSLAPTAAQTKLDHGCAIAPNFFQACIETLIRTEYDTLEASAVLVAKLSLIPYAQQQEISEGLSKYGVDLANDLLNQIIQNNHPGAEDGGYRDLLKRYGHHYSALGSSHSEEIFKDALLSYAVIRDICVSAITKSNFELRRLLDKLLSATPDYKREQNFAYPFFGLGRELYYRETGLYLSASELLGVLMLCDSRAQGTDSRHQAKLLSGYTGGRDQTHAMLALIAAFKAVTTDIARIEIFAQDNETAKELAYTHHGFFNALKISSTTTPIGTLEPNPRIVFTTLSEVTLQAKKGTQAPNIYENRLALIDGGNVAFAERLITPVDLTKPHQSRSLVQQSMVYWQNCEQHRVDEFLEIHPQFSDIPRNAVQICLGLAPNILGVNKSLIIAGERLYPPLLIPKRYSALINLTTSPQPASHELIFKESFGASTRDLVLPGATNDVISDYSIELTHNRYSYWNRVFEISKKAENKSGAALLIVTDAPVLFCSKLRANNIQSILLEEEPLTIESAKIFVCRPSNSHAIIFGASYAANDITTPNPRIDVLITNYIENPEELQRIKQIGSRSGISTSITHLIQKESLSRLNPHELLNLIQEDSKADPSSIHLKNSINFVRDADSLLHYFLYARRSKTIEVIKRALTRYEETLQLPEASLCELPGLADAILISLYHKYRTQISEAGALPDSLSIANQQYLDSDKDSEMVTLKEIFKNHFGRDVRDFLDDIADLDSQLKAKDNPIFEGYFEAPQMEGSNYGLEANDLHNLYVSLTDLFRLYVRQLALINQAMSKITEDTTLTFIRQLSD